MRATRRLSHSNYGLEWSPAEDRKLLHAARPKTDRWGRHVAPDWIRIARRLGRTALAVQGRVSILRAARRLAEAHTK
jgi:hypothetical protein